MMIADPEFSEARIEAGNAGLSTFLSVRCLVRGLFRMSPPPVPTMMTYPKGANIYTDSTAWERRLLARIISRFWAPPQRTKSG